MSRTRWLPWAVLCLTAAGCTSGDKIAAFRSTRTVSATAAPQGNNRQAEVAWRGGPGAAGYTLPAEYQRGWREGYADYLAYGNSGDPAVANRTRTSTSNEWLAGFRDGMTSAYTAVASEYPTLVAAAQPPFATPTMPVQVQQPATIVAEAPLPVPPTPRLEKMMQPRVIEAQAPAQIPAQSAPYTRMADNPRPMQGMPLPGGLRAEEVDQTAIWATGQQSIANQQPTIVRLPETGENMPLGTR